MNILQKYDGLGHSLLGLIIMFLWMVPFYCLLHSLFLAAVIGWCIQTQHWISREQRDYQISAGLDPHKISDVIKAYAFWRWSKMDLYAPLVVCGIVVLLTYLLK